MYFSMISVEVYGIHFRLKISSQQSACVGQLAIPVTHTYIIFDLFLSMGKKFEAYF